MPWEPILDGALADAARAAAREATTALLDVPADHASIPEALFWAYAAGTFEEDRAIAARYDAAVESLFTELASGHGEPWLFGGIVGRAWVVAHVSDNDEALAAFDERLRVSLPRIPAYDLILGLVGAGVYYLERARQGAEVEAALDAVVAALADRAEHTPEGVTWFTPPTLLPAWQRENHPDGYYNLGLAHGVPGAIAFLAANAARSPTARELAEGGLRWLSAQAQAGDPRGSYAAWTRVAAASSPARTAWCYGDPGVAAACWRAAVDLGRDPEPWRELARASAQRPQELTSIFDPNLCHGATGLAHLCNRYYQASREPVFGDAARRWFERALVMRRPGEGIAGFVQRRARPDRTEIEIEYITAPDFLDGTAGVVLALLAALRDDEPGWDRLLMIDLPVL